MDHLKFELIDYALVSERSFGSQSRIRHQCVEGRKRPRLPAVPNMEPYSDLEDLIAFGLLLKYVRLGELSECFLELPGNKPSDAIFVIRTKSTTSRLSYYGVQRGQMLDGRHRMTCTEAKGGRLKSINCWKRKFHFIVSLPGTGLLHCQRTRQVRRHTCGTSTKGIRLL